MNICRRAMMKSIFGGVMLLLSIAIIQFLLQTSHWLFWTFVALVMGGVGSFYLMAYYMCLKEVGDGKSDGVDK